VTGGRTFTLRRFWVPVDKREGVVKTDFQQAVREHRGVRQIRLRTKHSGDPALITSR
jgi:hypothetical protein